MRLSRLSANPYRRIPPPFPDPELVWRLRKLIRRRGRTSSTHSSWVALYFVAVAPLERRPARPRRPRLRAHLRRRVTRPPGRCSYAGNGPAVTKCRSQLRRLALRSTEGCARSGRRSRRQAAASRKVRGLQSVSSYEQSMLRRYLLNLNGKLPDDRKLALTVIPDFRVEDEERPDENALKRSPASRSSSSSARYGRSRGSTSS